MEAVVSASTGALQAVLPKLINLLTEEYKLHKGAKEGIRYIKSELVSMQVALEKAAEVSDQQVKLWARELRDMSYAIEDTIDSYMVRVGEPGSPDTTTCWCSIGTTTRAYKARRDIATEIERIKKDVEEISRRRERTKVDGVAAAPPAPSDPRMLALYEDAAKLVGIDSPAEEIIEKLSMEGEGASAQKLRLVSIVGPGGMGKTTLANAVHQKLHEQFTCTAFVSVSRKPNINKILSSILRQVTSKIKDVSKAKDKR
jgi:disease resistance protein RPM1